MKVVIGSRNKAKVRGIKRAFSLLGIRDFIEIEVKDLKPQPIGWDEIIVNAIKRVVASYRALNGSRGFGIGVEAGVVKLGGNVLSGQIAIVTDGLRYSIGLSGFFPIPTNMWSELRKGVELGVLTQKLSMIRNIASSIGAIGFFTKGYTTRTDLTYYATLYAIIPWLNNEIDFNLPPYSELEEILKSVD